VLEHQVDNAVDHALEGVCFQRRQGLAGGFIEQGIKAPDVHPGGGKIEFDFVQTLLLRQCLQSQATVVQWGEDDTFHPLRGYRTPALMVEVKAGGDTLALSQGLLRDIGLEVDVFEQGVEIGTDMAAGRELHCEVIFHVFAGNRRA